MDTKGKPRPAPGPLERAAAAPPPVKARPGAGGPPPDRPFHGRNEGVATGRPTEDDRASEHHHDGWNSNT